MKESEYIPFSKKHNIEDKDIARILDYLERHTLKEIRYDNNIIHLGKLPIYIWRENISVKDKDELIIRLPIKLFSQQISFLYPTLKKCR